MFASRQRPFPTAAAQGQRERGSRNCRYVPSNVQFRTDVESIGPGYFELARSARNETRIAR